MRTMTKMSPLLPPPQVEGDLEEQWRVLLARHATVSCALEKALQNEHGIGVSEFETLDHLIRTAQCGDYRMSDLSVQSYLSQSALSRAVARLERDGLVKRSHCSDDRRAIFVCATDQGRELHGRAQATHLAVLGQTLV